MKSDNKITITMSQNGCWWKCGDRQRQITRDQAMRILNVSTPEEIVVRSPKSGDVVLKQRIPDAIKARNIPGLEEGDTDAHH